jgi:hypothetical protein
LTEDPDNALHSACRTSNVRAVSTEEPRHRQSIVTTGFVRLRYELYVGYWEGLDDDAPTRRVARRRRDPPEAAGRPPATRHRLSPNGPRRGLSLQHHRPRE